MKHKAEVTFAGLNAVTEGVNLRNSFVNLNGLDVSGLLSLSVLFKYCSKHGNHEKDAV